MDVFSFPTTLERAAHLSMAQFEQVIAGKPLILLHPRHRSHGALVAMVFKHFEGRVFVHELAPASTALNGWLKQLANDPRLPQKLTALQTALSRRVKPEDLAAALGADLAGLERKRYALLVDGLDRLVLDSKAERFFRALPEHIPQRVQVVIKARLLDLQPWNDLIVAGQAAIVGELALAAGSMFGEAPDRQQLEVYALSGGHSYMNGRPVTNWDGTLPRNLFYFLVDHPMVTRDEIFAVFWPKMPIKEATNVFHVTKRKISECLGHDLTNYVGGFYVPARNLTVHYDARVFEHAVDAAVEDDQQAPALWCQAVQLYRSDFLPHIKMPWVIERRAILQQKYAQALINLGRYYRAQGDLNRALGFLLRALRLKPDWEDVHQDVLRIYQDQGRTADAVAQYARLERTLHDLFQIEPGRETRRLYQSITGKS